LLRKYTTPFNLIWHICNLMTMLLPFINEPLSGVIWRMEVDSLSNAIFLETRTADKQVSFTSIDLITGTINFKDLITPERWLTGIETAYNGILLLHSYQSENTPVHKGLTAIDNKGDVIWSNYNYAFDHLSVNGPILFNIQMQPKKLFLADINTGLPLRTYEQTIDTEADNHVLVPEVSSSFQLNSLIPIEAYGNIIHYLDYNNFRIVSLHSLTAGLLQQQLYITDGDRLVYEDLLNTDIQKMQPESFILYKNALIYIKNKSALRVINL
jgi:hypothetical protein